MKNLPLYVTMCTSIIAVSTASADVYPSMNITFDGMAADAKPTTQTVPTDGSALLKPTSVSEGSVNSVKTAKIYVRNGFSGTDTTNQVVVFENAVSGARSDLVFDCGAATTVTTGAYKLSFDVLTTGDTGATGPFWINIRGNPAGAGFGPIIASFGLYMTDTGAKINNNSGVTLTENVQYHLDYVVNLKDGTAGTASIYLNGNKVLNDVSITSGSIFRYITMGMDVVAQGTVMVDNVTVTAVPEPAAAGLLGVGAIALLIKRRRAVR